jgi:nitrogen fixation NifU-like protein
VDELYQEIILDHYRDPRNRGTCPGGTLCAEQDNPLCGDRITLSILLNGDRIDCIAFEGQGCSISLAAASMMTEAVKDLTIDQALELGESFRLLMRGESVDEDRLGDLMALGGVAKFPVRIKCALLPWMALDDALGGQP